MQVTLPQKVQPLFDCSEMRYVILYGGRGSGKSHSVAQVLILMAIQRKLRILCVREFQSSMRESCHRLLCDYIEKFNLLGFFDITDRAITGKNGSEFIFMGIRQNPQSVKSLEGVDIAWGEEGQTFSHQSMELLIPTIRKPGSQLWFTMNPDEESDPVYQMIVSPPPNTLLININYLDNPFCPQVLINEANYLKGADYESYDHIWLGKVISISDAVIFKGKYEVKEFESPEHVDFLHGLDWGFSADPAAMIRCYVEDYILYIDYEAYGFGIELDEYGPHLRSIPTGQHWKWYADCAQPGNISLLKRQGFNVEGAKKYAGSVEDGISHIKSYRKIVIHPRCTHTIEEFSKYSWKVDKTSGDIQPVPEDKNNHLIDALRYALNKYITKGSTSAATWADLAKINSK